MKTHNTWMTMGCAALIALGSSSGCSNSKKKPSDAGTGEDASAGMGGTGGKSGTGGKGGTGGRVSTTPTDAGAMFAITCSETPPTTPVTCGGQTCTAPAEFAMNPCVVPCCVTVNGKEMCASKSTAMGFEAECSLAATPDPNCPSATAMGMGMTGTGGTSADTGGAAAGAGTFLGCCNAAQGKCGIISTLRPGCITQSPILMLPTDPMSCTPAGSGEDGGIEKVDAGN